MKRLIFAFLPLAIGLVFTSCSLDDPFEGTWKATSAKIETASLNENLKVIVEEEYAKSIFHFLPEGKLKLERGASVLDGVYSLDEAVKTLTLSSAPDLTNMPPWSEEYKIVSQSSKEMTLSQVFDKKNSIVTIVMQRSME